MFRTICLLTCVLAVLSMFGCGGGDTPPTPDPAVAPPAEPISTGDPSIVVPKDVDVAELPSGTEVPGESVFDVPPDLEVKPGDDNPKPDEVSKPGESQFKLPPDTDAG